MGPFAASSGLVPQYRVLYHVQGRLSSCKLHIFLRINPAVCCTALQNFALLQQTSGREARKPSLCRSAEGGLLQLYKPTLLIAVLIVLLIIAAAVCVDVVAHDTQDPAAAFF